MCGIDFFKKFKKKIIISRRSIYFHDRSLIGNWTRNSKFERKKTNMKRNIIFLVFTRFVFYVCFVSCDNNAFFKQSSAVSNVSKLKFKPSAASRYHRFFSFSCDSNDTYI